MRTPGFSAAADSRLGLGSARIAIARSCAERRCPPGRACFVSGSRPKRGEPPAFHAGRRLFPVESASVGRAAARPSAHESAIDEKQEDRSRNRSEPGAEVKELVDPVTEAECLDDQAADECADNPDQRCDDETPGSSPGIGAFAITPASRPRMIQAMSPCSPPVGFPLLTTFCRLGIRLTVVDVGLLIVVRNGRATKAGRTPRGQENSTPDRRGAT